MQENYQDAMDAMFPQGYLIIYTCPDGQVRFNKYNPNKIVALAFWERKIREESEKLMDINGEENNHYENRDKDSLNPAEFEEWMDKEFKEYREREGEDDLQDNT